MRGERINMKNRVVLIVLAIVMMSFGIYRGEMAVVLDKAVNICLECIGIG